MSLTENKNTNMSNMSEEKSIKSVTLTGATSMIGISLTRLLVSNGIDVYCLIRKNSKRFSLLPKSPKVHIVSCGLDDIENFNPDFKSDAFVHLAWRGTNKDERNDPGVQEENVKTSIEAVKLASRLGCKMFLGAGSQAEYGIQNCKLTIEAKTNPVIAYGAAKLSAYYLTKMECEKNGINHCWVRILSVYGPNDHDDTLISSLIYSAYHNIHLTLSSCKQIWDFLYVDDASEAIFRMLKSMRGGLYNLGSGNARILREYVADLIEVVNKEYRPTFTEITPKLNFLEADVSGLTKELGWQPKTDFKQGIYLTLKSKEWYKG